MVSVTKSVHDNDFAIGVDWLISALQFSSVQFILFAFINYSTELHVIIIHLAGSPESYFAYFYFMSIAIV